MPYFLIFVLWVFLTLVEYTVSWSTSFNAFFFYNSSCSMSTIINNLWTCLNMLLAYLTSPFGIEWVTESYCIGKILFLALFHSWHSTRQFHLVTLFSHRSCCCLYNNVTTICLEKLFGMNTLAYLGLLVWLLTK